MADIVGFAFDLPRPAVPPPLMRSIDSTPACESDEPASFAGQFQLSLEKAIRHAHHRLALGAICVLATFAASSAASAPPTALAGGPYLLTFDGSIVLDGASSNAAVGTLVRYEWDIDGNGVFGDLTGAEPTLAWAKFPVGVGTSTIALKVRDSNGATATATAIVDVVTSHLIMHDHFRYEATAAAGPYGITVLSSDGRLYGTTIQGGVHDAGTLWRMNRDGSDFIVLRKFKSATDGLRPSGSPSLGGDGRLYGTARMGGIYGFGTLWCVNPDGTGFAVLRNFAKTADGAVPYAAPVYGTDGKLYGTNSDGGAHGAGTIWRINSDGTSFAVLRHLEPAGDGMIPFAAPVFGADGKLYGTAFSDGSSESGTLWRMNTDGTGFVVLRHFEALSDGRNPHGAPVFGPDGRLYGTNLLGGTHGGGTLWRMNSDGTDFVVLQHLGPNGAEPRAGPVFGPDGRIYGSTTYGGSQASGTLWRVDSDGAGFVVLRSLARDDGQAPYAPAVFGPDGILYGASTIGGASDNVLGYGTLWRMGADGSGYAVLKHLDLANNGSGPHSSTVFGPDGKIHGTTADGGEHEQGTVWQMKADGTGFAVSRHFESSSDGGRPLDSPVLGPDGRLYGATSSGGTHAQGTIWRMNRDGGSFTVLRHLDGLVDGARPPGGPVFGPDNRLFGSTELGGANDGGTLWRMNADGSGFTILRNFEAFDNPATPQVPLFGPDGKIYGTTVIGGAYDWGTLWRAQADGTEFETLRNFGAWPDGSFPHGTPRFGPDGRLYGTTTNGGEYDSGTVWRTNADGSEYVLLHEFEPNDGANPFRAPVFGPDGRLYGVTLRGGVFSDGTLWRMNADGTGFIVLQHFNRTTDGAGPFAAPVVGPGGKVYGTTSAGGTAGIGLIYAWSNRAPNASYSPTPNPAEIGETVRFNGSWSSDPEGDALVYEWDFGDGSPGAVRIGDAWIDHVFQSPGIFETTLRVTDSFGLSSAPVTYPVAVKSPIVGQLVNGSFEVGALGWNHGGNIRTGLSNNPYRGIDGGAVLSFNVGNSTPNGWAVQSITTVPGETYRVRFDVGAGGYSKTEQRLQLTIEGASTLLSRTISVFGLGGGLVRWLSPSYTFVADSATSTLTFRDVSPTTASIDLVLDNVRIEREPPLLLNGSFESGYSGWTRSGHQSIASSAPYTATAGTHLVVFNNGNTAPNGELTQSFATTPGRTYQLEFDAGVRAFNRLEQRLQVTLHGTGTLLSETVSISGAGGGAVRWISMTYVFVADSPTTTLTFRDVSPTTEELDLLLDNVRIR